jgi:hypothetical protein
VAGGAPGGAGRRLRRRITSRQPEPATVPAVQPSQQARWNRVLSPAMTMAATANPACRIERAVDARDCALPGIPIRHPGCREGSAGHRAASRNARCRIGMPLNARTCEAHHAQIGQLCVADTRIRGQRQMRVFRESMAGQPDAGGWSGRTVVRGVGAARGPAGHQTGAEVLVQE